MKVAELALLFLLLELACILTLLWLQFSPHSSKGKSLERHHIAVDLSISRC